MEWGKNRERKAERRKDKMQRSPEGIMELLSREGGLSIRIVQENGVVQGKNEQLFLNR